MVTGFFELGPGDDLQDIEAVVDLPFEETKARLRFSDDSDLRSILWLQSRQVGCYFVIFLIMNWLNTPDLEK